MGKLRKGTSIIEAAVAIGLMGIVLLWSLTAYTNVSKQSKTSEDIEMASTLASQQIEDLKTLQYTGITNTGIQGVASSSAVVQFSSPNDKYGYKYVVGTVQDNGKFYLKPITVNIYRMADQATPIIQMDCNFLRNESDQTNAGL